MTCTSLTVLLLLFHLLPFYTHGSFLVSSATQVNTSDVVGFKPPLPVEVSPISSPQLHGHKKTESGGRGESRPLVIGADSAEQEQTVGGMGAGLPTMSRGKAQLDVKDESPGDSAPRWLADILQPDGSVLDLLSGGSPSREQSLFLSELDDSSPVVKVSFSKPDQLHMDHIPPQEVQGGDPTSWTLSDYYDYLSPDYSTTESHADDERSTPADMEDENVQQDKKAGSRSECLLGFVRRNGTCQSPCDVYSSYCLNGGQCYVVEGIGAFCRCNVQEFVWNKGVRCESVITEFQVVCVVVSSVSVTLLVIFMIIVVFSKQLHLLKLQNKQLHKRSRSRPQSEQQNDNFSLSTVAEGSQANVRNECSSPPSNPPHALAYYDNIICQKPISRYTWECKPTEETYSQNDTVNPEEQVKTPVKEEEVLNLENSTTPQPENNTISSNDLEESGVTVDLELLLPNEVKTPPEKSSPLHYNVFLYKLPKSPKISPGRSRQGNVLPQIRPRRGSEPGYSPMSSRTPNPRLGKASTP